MQSRWFDFGGDTVVRADKYIRLAGDSPSQLGWVFSKIPLTATNWEIEFEFKIHGRGSLHGDGMALWITKQRGQEGPVFGSTDKFEGLGIFFDTYKNNRPGTVFPYVMAMVGDGQTSYDKDTDGRDQELAGCSARGIRGASIPTRAKVTYFQDRSLKLELKYKFEEVWEPCFETGPVPIPSVAYLGFSAETGELSDNFDIISVETKNLYDSSKMNLVKEPTKNLKGGGKEKKDKAAKKDFERKKKASKAAAPDTSEKRGWGSFFVKVVVFFIVCVGGYIGFTVWRTSSKRHSRFD